MVPSCGLGGVFQRGHLYGSGYEVCGAKSYGDCGSMDYDQAGLLFAAMIGVNMLSRRAADASWISALRKSVKDVAAR